jgi:hypothetical protein
MSAKPPPSSSVTPPPTGGGSTKYVVVVVLLGAGLAALLLWKSCSKPEPVASTNPVTSTLQPPPPPPKEDDVPPPPPIEDAATSNTTRPTFAGNPCDVKACGGAATPDLETALAFRAKQAHRCYDAALAQDETLQGHVKISVRVASNGQVCASSVASTDLSNASVANCIATMFRSSGHFPPPRGGCVDANVPIALLPPGQH